MGHLAQKTWGVHAIVIRKTDNIAVYMGKPLITRAGRPRLCPPDMPNGKVLPMGIDQFHQAVVSILVNHD